MLIRFVDKSLVKLAAPAVATQSEQGINPSADPILFFYAEVDGTGVPMVAVLVNLESAYGQTAGLPGCPHKSRNKAVATRKTESSEQSKPRVLLFQDSWKIFAVRLFCGGRHAGVFLPLPGNRVLFKRLHVCHQRLDFIIAQTFGWFHLRFVPVLDAFFDGLEHFVVLELGLNFGIGEVLRAGFLAHFSFRFAVRAVAFDAMFFVSFFHVCG